MLKCLGNMIFFKNLNHENTFSYLLMHIKHFIKQEKDE